jgi:uncharacterized protein YcfL
MKRRKYLATTLATVSGMALAGCSSEGDSGVGGSDIGSDGGSEGQCDPATIESTDPVRWEGVANGTFEIESVDLTLTNQVDFPVSVTATVYFYGEGGATDIEAMPSVSTILEAGESEEFEITRTGFDAVDWSVGLSESCL